MTSEQLERRQRIYDEMVRIVHSADSDTDDLIDELASYAEVLYYRGYEAAVSQEQANVARRAGTPQ